MSSASSAQRRTYLLCQVCKKTQAILSVHLRRTCMKKATDEEIERTVEAAKDEAHQLLHTGRMWEYGTIRVILDNPDPVGCLIKELQDRGNFVANIPPQIPPQAAPAPVPSVQPSVSTMSVETESDSGSLSSGELYQCPENTKQTTSLREKMFKSGLYSKHSIDHPLLKSFARYLEVDLANENFKQEVENVARFTHYMDPEKPSLLFVRQYEKTRQYFRALSETGLSRQTVQNYIKSVKRFLKFHVGSTDLYFEDDSLHKDCNSFISFLSNLQAVTSKQVSKEVTRKRFDILNKGTLPIKECVAVLEVARKDFLAVIGKLNGPDRVSGNQLPKQDQFLVLYYLEAVIILRHLQRPGVVEHMTVNEWLSRKRVPGHGGHVVIGVKEHKTTQVATFALSQEEELWFELYYTEVRSALAGNKRQHTEEEDTEEWFFISSAGKQIYNASNDLERFHKRYGVPRVTSQMARQSFKTATKHLTDAQKSMVADYLTHTTATAERHSMREAENVFATSLLIKDLVSDTENGDSGVHTRAGASSSCMSERSAYVLLVKSYPVVVDGTAPKKSERKALTGVHERHCYDRWRSEQLQLRVKHVLEAFGRRLPSEARVRSWMEKQGWTANQPDAALIVKQWKPSGAVDTAADSDVVRKLIRSQKWRGLVVTNVEGKGRGVLASRPFCAGEVVCDCHGQVVSRKEGLRIHNAITEGGFMFFYKDSAGVPKCIDAHQEECPCHPGRSTFGRLINHSSKRANLRPRLYSIEGQDIILFIATRDIKVNDELLFNYGVSKRSFVGEGLNLQWL